jgi:hypothetical protein
MAPNVASAGSSSWIETAAAMCSPAGRRKSPKVAVILKPGQVVRPWAYGKFSRREEGHGPQQGDIWVCKLGWWAGAPQDVLDYAGDHPTYPGDSTLGQLYNATEFGAYQQLGAATVHEAVRGTPSLRLASPAPAQVSLRDRGQRRGN